jgi:hypothetical protein
VKPTVVFESNPIPLAGTLLGRRSSPAVRAAAATALVLALALLIGVCVNLWRTESRTAAHRQLAESLRASVSPRAVAPRAGNERAEQEQLRAWNQVARQLNTPWGTLLTSLEQATPEDVALVSVEPDAHKGSVRLQAEARTLEALLAYAQALRAVPAFADVVPLKHETNELDPLRPVRLSLEIRLLTAARSER